VRTAAEGLGVIAAHNPTRERAEGVSLSLVGL